MGISDPVPWFHTFQHPLCLSDLAAFLNIRIRAEQGPQSPVPRPSTTLIVPSSHLSTRPFTILTSTSRTPETAQRPPPSWIQQRVVILVTSLVNGQCPIRIILPTPRDNSRIRRRTNWPPSPLFFQQPLFDKLAYKVDPGRPPDRGLHPDHHILIMEMAITRQTSPTNL